jgi:plasmid stabilization system protein ParE
MKVQFSRGAQRDVDLIFEYLSEHSPPGAQSVLREIARSADRLGDFPLMGSATSSPGVRSLALRHYPYKVFNRVRQARVFIIHGRHTSRRPWRAMR